MLFCCDVLFSNNEICLFVVRETWLRFFLKIFSVLSVLLVQIAFVFVIFGEVTGLLDKKIPKPANSAMLDFITNDFLQPTCRSEAYPDVGNDCYCVDQQLRFGPVRSG